MCLNPACRSRWSRLGEIAPLDDLFTPETRADFSTKDLALNTVGGRIYGVKMFDDTAALYYRKSLLEKAGVEPPRTMDALIDAVKKLNAGDRKGLFVGNDGGVGSLLTLAPWSADVDFWWTARSRSTPRARRLPTRKCWS